MHLQAENLLTLGRTWIAIITINNNRHESPYILSRR